MHAQRGTKRLKDFTKSCRKANLRKKLIQQRRHCLPDLYDVERIISGRGRGEVGIMTIHSSTVVLLVTVASVGSGLAANVSKDRLETLV